jgi:HEAT repeat protein
LTVEISELEQSHIGQFYWKCGPFMTHGKYPKRRSLLSLCIFCVLSSLMASCIGSGSEELSAEEKELIGKRDKAQTIQKLIETLEDDSPLARFEAVTELAKLGKLGDPNDSVVSALRATLKKKDWKPRLAACIALEKLGPKAALAVPELTEILADSLATVRAVGASALGRIGSAAAPAVPSLTIALKDTDKGVAGNAARALSQIGPSALGAIPALIIAFVDEDFYFSSGAAQALSKLNPFLANHIHSLSKFLRGNYEGRRAAVFVAVKELNIGKKGALPVFIASFALDEGKVWLTASHGLSKLGPMAVSAVPQLITALKHKDSGVRGAAANALGKIGPGASIAIPALTVCLKDDDWVKGKAKVALLAIQKQGK